MHAVAVCVGAVGRRLKAEAVAMAQQRELASIGAAALVRARQLGAARLLGAARARCGGVGSVGVGGSGALRMCMVAPLCGSRPRRETRAASQPGGSSLGPLGRARSLRCAEQQQAKGRAMLGLEPLPTAPQESTGVSEGRRAAARGPASPGCVSERCITAVHHCRAERWRPPATRPIWNSPLSNTASMWNTIASGAPAAAGVELLLLVSVSGVALRLRACCCWRMLLALVATASGF